VDERANDHSGNSWASWKNRADDWTVGDVNAVDQVKRHTRGYDFGINISQAESSWRDIVSLAAVVLVVLLPHSELAAHQSKLSCNLSRVHNAFWCGPVQTRAALHC
jgi:hypothetical protein